MCEETKRYDADDAEPVPQPSVLSASSWNSLIFPYVRGSLG